MVYINLKPVNMINISDALKPVGELLLTSKPLKDKDLMVQPVSLNTDQSVPIDLNIITFTIGAGAEASVQLFNDEDDADPDTFIAPNGDITFDPATEAYLKYVNAITAKANGSGSIANIGFNMDLSANGSARSLFYKKHANTDNVNAAFIADVTNYRTIFDREDVKALQVGDALAFTVNGSFSGNLKISWSDVLSSSLNLLTGILPSPVTLDLSLTPSFSASFDFSIQDDFRYFIKKESDTHCLVTFKKGKVKTTGISAGASIGVGLTNTDEVKSQLNELYNKLIQLVFRHTSDEIDAAIEKVKDDVAGVTTGQQEIVDELLAYFNLNNVADKITALTSKIQEIKSFIPDRIAAIANANINFSLSYQYKRIKEETELLSIQIQTEKLTEEPGGAQSYHGDLLRLNPSRLVNDIRQNLKAWNDGDIVKVNSYLNESTLTISKTFGIGLKLFNINILGQDNSEFKDVIRQTIDNAGLQVSMERALGYKWALGNPGGSWQGSFTADMEGFSKQPIPTLDEFDYSMLINITNKQSKIKEDWLRDDIDTAVVWGMIRQEDFESVVAKYLKAAEIQNKQVLTEHKLLFKPDVMKLLVATIAANGWSSANLIYLAQGLGGAMEYRPEFELRRTAVVREQTYFPLWQDYLQNFDSDTDIDDVAAAAEQRIRQLHNPDHLAEFEADPDNRIFAHTYAGLIRSNPDLKSDLKDFIIGVQALNTGIQQHGKYSDFNTAYKKISGVFSQSVSTKAVGYLLLQHAIDLNVLKDVSQVFTITVDPDGANPQVINFSVI